MSSLAKIRQLPTRPAPATSVDLVRLGDLYRQARVADQHAYDLRREGEDIIRAAYSEGVPVARLAEITGLTKQRAYQVIGGPTVKPLEESSNGTGST